MFWNPERLVQFSSVAQSCPTFCDPMNRSPPGLPVYHQLPEFTQTHVHHVSDAIQPSHPLSSPSPPAPNPSQYQGLFQRVSSSHEVAKELEFLLCQHSQAVFYQPGHPPSLSLKEIFMPKEDRKGMRSHFLMASVHMTHAQTLRLSNSISRNLA